MAVIGVRGTGKRPQRTDGLMLAVPFRGQLVSKSWPRPRITRSASGDLARIARMALIEWLAKFITPCQKKWINDAAHDLHMRPRDLAYQALANRLFVPEDKHGKQYWPIQIHNQIDSAVSAFGTADDQMLMRGPNLWTHTEAATPLAAAVWNEKKGIVQFSATVE